jgi:hypothetical protein
VNTIQKRPDWGRSILKNRILKTFEFDLCKVFIKTLGELIIMDSSVEFPMKPLPNKVRL